MSTPLLGDVDLEQASNGLVGTGIEGPHAFIRGLDATHDRHLHVSRLLRTLPPGDDFRRRVRIDGQEAWVLLERLAWDSAFFSRGMARLDACLRPGLLRDHRADTGAEAAALGQVLREASGAGIDYVFCQVAPSDLPMMRILTANGFELIETRCHYHRALQHPPAERYATRLATAEDVPSLARAAREMVNTFDRFHADVSIPTADADLLMERWVEASITGGFADATIVPDVPQPEAFCTAKYHREHWDGWGIRLAQPVLSAVSPRHRGWYFKIISELDEHLRSIGATHSFLVTQLTNNAVIRSWEKLGYQFGKGEHVFRKVLA